MQHKKVLLLVLTSVVFVDAGQLLLKKGLTDVQPDFAAQLLSSFVAMFTNPFVVLGVILFVTSSFFWLLALSKSHLSYAYPILSVSYVMVAILSWLFFNESVSLLRLLGLGIIVGGVAMLAKT